MRLSPDGLSVALVKNMPDGSVGIWLMDLAHGSPVPFIINSSASIGPVWSPRGDEIVFSAFRDGRYRMYRKPVSGGSSEELVQTSEQNQAAGDWTRDPPRIVYYNARAEALKKWIIASLPLAPGGKPVVIDDSSAVKFGPRVAPSGRWVAYASNESGGVEIYVRPMPDGERPAGPRIRISTGGGANPAWSADGNTLFYNSPDDRLLSVKLKIAGDRIEAGEPMVMFPLQGTSSHNGGLFWEPIGNGERFVVLRSAPVTGRDNRINVMLNWQAALN